MAFVPASSHQPVLTRLQDSTSLVNHKGALPVPPLQLGIPRQLLEEGWQGFRVRWRALRGRGMQLGAPGLGLAWPCQSLPRLGAAMGVAESTGDGRVAGPKVEPV